MMPFCDNPAEDREDCFRRMSQRSSDTMSSIDLWDDSSGLMMGGDNADLFKNGFSDMVQQLQDKQSCVVKLENEIKHLKEEKMKQEYQNHICVARLKDEITKLEKKAEFDIEDLKRRQNKIETDVPSLGDQIKSLKDVLHDLNISETLYSEIIAIPKESRTIREHILLLAYEKMLSYRNDIEALRHERDISREALLRANDEVQKLRRDMQRNAAVSAFDQQSRDKEAEAILARNERLEAELQGATLQMQILSAKGVLYDEVKCSVIKMEEMVLVKEEEKAVLSKTLQNSISEKQQCEESLRSKEHCIELLQMDKAYLQGQLKAQEEQLLKAETEKRNYENKMKELEQGQQSFYDQLLHNEKARFANLDQSLHDEKKQIQERNKQELELLRTQVFEAAEFEIQMLRKTRDLAVAECENFQAALKQTRKENEDLLKKCVELQTLSLRNGNAEGNISRMDSELQKRYEETYQLLCQSVTENELLVKKVEVLTQKLTALENDMDKSVADLKLKLESATANLKQYQVEEQILNDIVTSAFKVLVDADEEVKPPKAQSEPISGIQGRVDVVFMVLKKCKFLQENIKILENEKERLQSRLTDAEQMKDEMMQKIAYVDRPISSVVSASELTEKKLKEIFEQKEALEVKLREALADKEKATRALQSLKNDLKRLLETRGNIEGLQKLLIEKDFVLGNAVLEKLRRSSSCS